MEQIKKYLGQMSDHNRRHYEYELSKISEAEKQRLEALVARMAENGAKKPFEWAWSEFREGIPQWARFMILKGMYQSVYDIEGSVDAGNEFDQQTSNIHQKIADKIGTEKLNQFLIGYAKGMLYNMLGIFDEGNFDHESKDSWMLVEYDIENDRLGKPISGLHEDFLEFEQEIFPAD